MKTMVNIIISFLALFTSCTTPNDKLEPGMYADIKTNKGNVLIKLEFEKVPMTVANFVALSEGKHPLVKGERKGKPFYDGLTFHRVIKDFMVQGGDPEGTGSGDPGYRFEDEFDETLKHNKPGILSMANAGAGTNGSQFFITHKETPWLDSKHTVFGEVIEGMDIVNTIAQGDIIEKVTIIRKGKDAKRFKAEKVFTIESKKIKKEKEEALQKAAAVIANQVEVIKDVKENGTKTASGLTYKTLNIGMVTPKKGDKIFVNYAGFLTNGSLFDTSYAEIAKEFGKYDANRFAQQGYTPFEFEYGKKDGLIPGFLEMVNSMKLNDKIMVYIPAKMAYGSQAMGHVIPANSDLVFIVELLEKKN